MALRDKQMKASKVEDRSSSRAISRHKVLPRRGRGAKDAEIGTHQKTLRPPPLCPSAAKNGLALEASLKMVPETESWDGEKVEKWDLNFSTPNLSTKRPGPKKPDVALMNPGAKKAARNCFRAARWGFGF